MRTEPRPNRWQRRFATSSFRRSFAFISLVVYREIAFVPLASAWISGVVNIPSPGIRLYDGTCLIPSFIPTSATTFNTSGAATWIER